MATSQFYDQLTPFYHLIFADWDASIQRQAVYLDSVVRDYVGSHVQTVLDVSCGIGTQALGLAQLGYNVTASDLSSSEIERARGEAAKRGLAIQFSVADMREVYAHHQQQYDLVISCDNSVPHLLTDDDILIAFRQFYACTKPNGGCLITVRDYDQEDKTGVQVKPYGVRVENDIRYLVFQVWEYHGDIYDLAFYFVEDSGDNQPKTHVMRSQYYAVGTDKLMALLTAAGFHDVQRLDERFYQPVIVGRRGED
jgi:SAM-dependent methyltransferase